MCANFGLAMEVVSIKSLAEIFLYKFLNDKFLYEVQQADERLKDSENVEQTLNNMLKMTEQRDGVVYGNCKT